MNNSADEDGKPRKRLVDGRLRREEKRKKWEAKLESIGTKQRRDEEIEQWIKDRHHYVTRVTPPDVIVANEHLERSDPACSNLTKLLLPYFQLQDPAQPRRDSGSRLFVAEGTETVRLLIRQSVDSASPGLESIQIQSIFLKSALFFEEPVNLLADVEKAMEEAKHETQAGQGVRGKPASFRVLIAEENVLSSVAGFPISRGVLACGFVPDRDREWLVSYLQVKKDRNVGGALRLLAVDGVCDTANLGSMIRTASAFRIDAVILSGNCCDPWYRRAIRVSMGHIFRVPCVRVDSLALALQTLSTNLLSVTCYAAVADRNADILLECIKPGTVPIRWCCVVGNEANGISGPVRKACSYSLRIDMDENVDSLSVPIATGILLHGLKEREVGNSGNVATINYKI